MFTRAVFSCPRCHGTGRVVCKLCRGTATMRRRPSQDEDDIGSSVSMLTAKSRISTRLEQDQDGGSDWKWQWDNYQQQKRRRGRGNAGGGPKLAMKEGSSGPGTSYRGDRHSQGSQGSRNSGW